MDFYTFNHDLKLESSKLEVVNYYDNYRNNHVLIQFSDGSLTEYVYTANGEKLRTIHRKAAMNITASLGQTRELHEIMKLGCQVYD